MMRDKNNANIHIFLFSLLFGYTGLHKSRLQFTQGHLF